jgi:hypothetical protein
MRVRPIARALLVKELAERIHGYPTAGRVRVGIDGPLPAEPDRLAAELIDALRLRGHPAVHVPASGFWRAASLRLERAGRTRTRITRTGSTSAP